MARTQLKALIILCALLAGVCLTLAQDAQVAQPPPPITFPEWKEVDRNEKSIEYSVSFPSVMSTPYPMNDIVPLRILIPADAKGPTPVVIVLHYWGTRDLKTERAMGAELNRHGVSAILITLPYHLSRTPPGFASGELALEPDPELLISNMTQSIWDVRRTIDWLDTRAEFDHSKVGVAGTSLGAIVSVLAYAVDARITHAAFLLGGVDVAHIIWNSSRTVRERDMLRKRGFTEERLRQALVSIEPLTYLKPKEDGATFVVGARYDTVVPRSSTDKLINALDHPKTLFVETGHYGGLFVQRRLLREVGNFFGAEFGGKTFVPPGRIYAPTVRIGAIANTATGFDLAIGLDLLRLDKRGNGFGTLLVSPRGPEIFIGRKVDSRISFGAIATRRKVGLGFFWSTVL